IRMERPMKKLAAAAIFAAATAGLGSVQPATAHHSFSMFDNTVTQFHNAVVLQWAFNNPHIMLYVLIINEAGTGFKAWTEADAAAGRIPDGTAAGDPIIYGFEGASPSSLAGNGGFTGTTYVYGQRLQIVTCPLRDGRPGGAIGII